MTAEKDQEDSGEVRPRKLTLVSGLALLVGLLVTVLAVGGVLYYQTAAALKLQLRTAGKELKQKSVALDELKAQVEGLSEQLHALKAHAVAHSAPPGEVPATSAAPAPAAAAAPAVDAPAAEPAKVKKARTKRPGEDCELVGKSPAEQATTLQRCVAAMDAPPAKGRSR